MMPITEMKARVKALVEDITGNKNYDNYNLALRR